MESFTDILYKILLDIRKAEIVLKPPVGPFD